ncbi:hypothetical protein [uncultured Jatrophihabitans sp.]|uniref:hypothetical protein n=1 Tax=uncultured Jatrophihabitans sp. TaxID=1610747 RepID=UPI0035CC4B1E
MSAVKGRVVDKTYEPARTAPGKDLPGRAEDEFQLLVQPRHGEPVWVSVNEDRFNAVQVGARFTSNARRKWAYFRGLHDSPAMSDPAANTGQGWTGAANR